MRNFIQPGAVLTLAAPYDVASGDGLKVGSIFGVAATAALSGADVETALTGVYDLKKAASQAWTVGAAIYWDDTLKQATTDDDTGGNMLIGVAVAAVGSGAGEIVGRVRLKG